jgi:hypothetical protein
MGAITLSGNGTIKLTPPSTGTYTGILIFQARDNAKAVTLSGNAMQGVAGTIYAPAAQLSTSGNGQIGSTSNPLSIVVDTLTASGNAVADGLTLNSPTGTVAYTPAQIRAAYGLSALSLDGTGQTIAIVDAYDHPNIFQSVDAFDIQFGLATTGPSLYDQYGPASSFLTVLNQSGQATNLPSADPTGAGSDNWEVEEALDVEWVHAIAPGAQIVLVEANSQSFSDLMASAATAASQPGVSVVSMSWGFAEGQAVFAAAEAEYDSVFKVPGVTFVASTGDYGTADPEYPAFSPNVVAVGGTSLTLNADNSYNSETGWGYYSSSAGASIGSGGGISLYEPEPAYQQGVQSLGMRTTPDVSLVADPATGAWIADSYNLDPSNPFQVVGGTSLSAPAWAGLVAVVNQGRSAAGEPALNSSGPTEAQQALYALPQSDYNTIASGSNGYNAAAGFNLVTGLGTPVANLLVSDLVAYQGSGTAYKGPTVGPLQNATLDGNWTGSGGPTNVFRVFSARTVSSIGLGHAQAFTSGSSVSAHFGGTSAPVVAANPAMTITAGIPVGPTLELTIGSLAANGSAQVPGWGVNSSPVDVMAQPAAGVALAPVSTGLPAARPAWSAGQAAAPAPTAYANAGRASRADRFHFDGLIVAGPRAGMVSDAVLNELASDLVLWQAPRWDGTITIPVQPADAVPGTAVPTDTSVPAERSQSAASFAERLALLGMTAGLWGGAGIGKARKRRSASLPLPERKPLKRRPRWD